MYKVEDITITYGQAADILNACDSEGILIFIQLQSTDGLINIPIDNFEYFKELTSHDPDDIFPLELFEENDIIYLQEVSFD